MNAPSPILEFVRDQLNASGESMAEVAKATGVSKRWLEMMRAGAIPKPGVPHVDAIARHFGYELRAVPSSDREAA